MAAGLGITLDTGFSMGFNRLFYERAEWLLVGVGHGDFICRRMSI